MTFSFEIMDGICRELNRPTSDGRWSDGYRNDSHCFVQLPVDQLDV